MEENQEQKHVCKFCKKSFRCGRSLGGHMRSHLTMNSAEAEEKLNRNSFMGSEAGGHTSYGLRENPKKTWRLSDSRSAGLEQDKVCKECGKGFQSWKALFGHMRCHSDRERLSNSLGDDSLTSSNQKLVMDSQSDNETAAPRKRRRSKRRRQKIATTSSSFSVVNGSSSVSEIEQEQEEVAMCLMMLSRDVGYWSGLNSVADSSDNNSFVLETRSSGMDQGITKTESIDLVCNGGETVKIEKPRDKNLESGILDSDAFLIKKKIYEFGVSDSQFLRHGVKKVDSEVSMDGFPGGDELKKPKLDDESGNDVSVAESGKYSHIRYKPTEAELGKDSFTVFDQSDSSCRKYNSTKRIMELDYDSRYKVSDAEVGKDLYNSYKFTEAELGKGTIKETGFDQADSRSKKYKPSKRTRRDDWNPELEENSSKRACDGIDSHLCKDARRKSKFECTTCNKIFHSYQALGGHRASHKKIKGCFASRIESSENSIETDISPDPTSDRKLIKVCDNENQTDHEIAGRVETSYAPKKNKEHECPICFKVFASGQALGGHKRSHLVGGSEAGGEQTIVIQKQLPEINDLLDLNLPAAIEEETDGHVGFKPWWVGSSHESEPLVGLISN